jgi:hypothetical protein
VRELFGAVARDFEFERHLNGIEWDSLDGFADHFVDRFPPLVTARAMLGERFGELRERLIDVWGEFNEADDGSFTLPQEYLLSVVRP